MNACHAQLIGIIQRSRDTLVRESTDIAATTENAIPRAGVEQMLHACVALIEEGLVGESTEVRSDFLEALPEIARASTWDMTLEGGLACWGVIVCKLAAEASREHRDEAIVFLSRFMGTWWRDVSKVMLPVFLEAGKK